MHRNGTHSGSVMDGVDDDAILNQCESWKILNLMWRWCPGAHEPWVAVVLEADLTSWLPLSVIPCCRPMWNRSITQFPEARICEVYFEEEYDGILRNICRELDGSPFIALEDLPLHIQYHWEVPVEFHSQEIRSANFYLPDQRWGVKETKLMNLLLQKSRNKFFEASNGKITLLKLSRSLPNVSQREM